MLALYPVLQLAAPVVAQYGINTAINYLTNPKEKAQEAHVNNTGKTLGTLAGMGVNAGLALVMPEGLAAKAVVGAANTAVQILTNELYKQTMTPAA